MPYLNLWNSWYQGDVPAFHYYKVYNGSSHIHCKRSTLNMAKKVCEDWANLLMNEKVCINISNPETAKFVNSVWRDNNFWVKINEMQEFKSALGTVAYVPYLVDSNVSPDGVLFGGNVKIDYITAENIFPISWDNGKIIECGFASERFIDGKSFTYLQLHTLENGCYVVENLLFDNTLKGCEPVENINSYKGFENVANKIYTNSSRRLFVIDRLNIANSIDKASPYGMSVFASSLDVLKGIDIIYDSYNNEFIMGKKRILVNIDSINYNNGSPAFDSNDLVFYQLPSDYDDSKFIHEIDMTLRADAHEIAIANRLNLLAVKCGFGETHYQFSKNNVATATQVISQNVNQFRALKKHELILNDVLVELTDIIIHLGVNVLKLPIASDTEISVSFNDSIIEDTAEIKRQALTEFQNGLISAEDYHHKVYGITQSKN